MGAKRAWKTTELAALLVVSLFGFEWAVAHDANGLAPSSK